MSATDVSFGARSPLYALTDQITMPLVIGTDEAGYAPNLGPLVVAATAWQVPRSDFDFYSELQEQVSAKFDEDDSRLFIADSKSAYRAGSTLTYLEAAVLALLASYRTPPTTIRELIDVVCGSRAPVPAHYEWRHDQIPRDADCGAIARHRDSLCGAFAQHDVKLVRVAAKMIFPDEFNQLCRQHGNKASLLSVTTLTLVRELLATSDESCTIVCDRHGGRARYAPLIQQFLTDQWSQVLTETSQCSSYSWSNDARCYEIHFRVGGESYLPTAAASMTAKYLRELMMAGWNHYWKQWNDELRPTAGYPGDAKRFLHDVRPIMQRLGIERSCIWRSR
jgi:hypothetical protein